MSETREPSGLQLLRGLLRHYPFVLKNFRHYFQNLYRREVLHTKVVAPYAAVFYATHKCNLDCNYCTQKEPDVFSDELPTDQTVELLTRPRVSRITGPFSPRPLCHCGDREELLRCLRAAEAQPTRKGVAE